MSIIQTFEDIRSLKIQGAQAIAIAGLQAIFDLVHSFKGENPRLLRLALDEACDFLLSARVTEPFMANSFYFVIFNSKGKSFYDYKKSILNNIRLASNNLKEGQEAVAEIGSHKILKSMVVYTHCHSSSVVKILLKAKKLGVPFEVHNTETRPLYQGRKTAKELSEAGIPVIHYVDSGARVALRKADIVLLGCDAIESDGSVINKIGSALFAEMAYHYDIPVYICSHSWKFKSSSVKGFDIILENRELDEVWSDAPKGVSIRNPAFEKIPATFISGIISELGIFPPQVFFEEIEKKYGKFRH